jgi:hypothetical protein
MVLGRNKRVSREGEAMRLLSMASENYTKQQK